MKKTSLLCIGLFLLFKTAHTEFDSFLRPEVGFLKYHIFKTDLLDAAGASDYIKTDTTKYAPVVRFSFGYQYNDLGKLGSKERTSGRFGLSIQYAKKSNAVIGSYYDFGYAESAFVTKQSINRVDGLVFFEYDFAQWYGFEYTAGIGAGVTHGVLKKINLYQSSNNAFTGQSLAPHSISPTGYFSLGIARSFDPVPDLKYQINYHLGLAGVKYKSLIVQSEPDGNAGLYAQNAFDLLEDVSLVKAPYFTVLSNELSFGLQWEF